MRPILRYDMRAHELVIAQHALISCLSREADTRDSCNGTDQSRADAPWIPAFGEDDGVGSEDDDSLLAPGPRPTRASQR